MPNSVRQTPSRRAERSSALPKQPDRRASDHLTIADVCRVLKISRSTFYDWRAKRKAPKCFRLPNGDLRIRQGELDRWLNALEEVGH
ncbi:helix-turn-helix domain-containing protein [Natronosporangium hydrolyticum]|uniref:Helix-turn-helix domain-containing protein n=1 Tax=Natronosporangium hydrolyticum TaxID=2811111 RepID=A0A895YRR7_9ACTN|nr:helix-turn-helix domain-containing protein [Natronosporangium hydrolyticum]QSB17496.1 helix-turn-helix domain-containing protein [Natronosporangium hydrolyticum]